jgi:hypothetical protein
MVSVNTRCRYLVTNTRWASRLSAALRPRPTSAYSSQTCDVCGWVDKRNRAPKVNSSGAGVVSLGTSTTPRQSSSQPAVPRAGAKSCAHTQRPPQQPVRAAEASLTAARNHWTGQQARPFRDGSMTAMY